MQVEIFCLCDAATENFGKLNILGAFDAIFAKEIPCVHPQCAVVVRMRFESFEMGDHDVHVSFVDADGAPVIPAARGMLHIQQAGSANLILNLQSLRFTKNGLYAIHLLVDGQNRGTLPLMINHQPAAL